MNKKHPLILLTLFTVLHSAAQTFTVEGGSGLCISFNKLVSPTGLPPKTKIVRKAGLSFSMGLRYERNHSLTAFSVSTASITRGFRTNNLITERNSNGTTIGMDNSANIIRNAPVHFTLGSGYTTAIHNKFKITALGGVGYIIAVNKLSQQLENSYTSSSNAPIPEERVEYLLNESIIRNGNLGIWGETGTSVQLNTRSSLGITFRYYHGLKTITKLDSEIFRYTNTRENYQENYDVQLLNKGRYASLRLSYYYTL